MVLKNPESRGRSRLGTISKTRRYVHLSQEHKKKAVNLLTGLTASKTPPAVTNMSQNCHNPDFAPVACQITI